MSGSPPRTLVIGSFNEEKAAEMAALLVDLGVSVRSLKDCPHVEPVPEDGATFAENARTKALGLAAQIEADDVLGLVADDSGLEVDAMDRRPGVYSARYLGEDATDAERVSGILGELGDLPPEKRTARFRCHVAFVQHGNVVLESDGAVEGRIAFAPAGDSGFGYDPIFVPEGYDRTFAELGAEVKHRTSHRSRALCRFHEQLLAFLSNPEVRQGDR